MSKERKSGQKRKAKKAASKARPPIARGYLESEVRANPELQKEFSRIYGRWLGRK